MTLRRFAGLGALLSLLSPGLAMAQEATLDSGDTAWMLTATALVLFMTIPGLALFYGGMVRSKNILSVMMQCFAITGLMSILWMVYGYSLAFDTTGMEAGVTNFNSFVGGLDRAFLSGLTPDSLVGAFPESVFITFQMTFAIITPALIVGAFAERMKFSAMLVFMGVWFTLVYAPIAHMVWGGDGGLMWDWGVLDFAGGTVVHINAGIAGLVACLVLGKRKGFPTTPMAPHNLGLTLVGAAMLWIGWFGFNAGSAVAANGTAGMAMLVTQIATAAAALGWMFAEWIGHGKPSALGIASGVVAGLVAITPAAGTVGPMGALIIGLVSGVVCFFCATSLKRKLGYDDSLDAFGVHGVGGIVGALLTGIFAAPMLGGFGEVENIGLQLWIQFKGVLFTVVYTGIVTYLILKAIDLVIGLRVNEEQETIGLDLSLHNERGYNL
ncbi:ammonium transporter [Stutzerimonas stutzeri]|jgi:Amt family ammonium transporter|uniref:Ammonium transporter n=1 Tax=Stutzerimonas stutzeri TaxID=316 RepID=A0AA40RNC5_STUST|nr:ammonium transporter [Stutzerimonas stutzeri]MBA1302992.1 ammonium transporter [Stutzerimonas stutzeri]MDH0724999.1 ammonium transporter [Stutzerimonas stutzeri]MDI9726752.1 ammonium transporter [Stutzerimonas stutzeri]MDI9746859.1 ammonium transporter [Stutzerimonas stutzeri]RRV31995.1 ammonium transporter [Stutzerimonas stutzeri]